MAPQTSRSLGILYVVLVLTGVGVFLFKEMAQKVVKQITDDEALIAFRMIDYDGRDTISYPKLEKYFCLMNDLEGKDFK